MLSPACWERRPFPSRRVSLCGRSCFSFSLGISLSAVGTPPSRCTAAAGGLETKPVRLLLQTAHVYNYIAPTSCIRKGGSAHALGFTQPRLRPPEPPRHCRLPPTLAHLGEDAAADPGGGSEWGLCKPIVDGSMGALEGLCIGCIQAGKREEGLACQPPASNFPTPGVKKGQASSRARAGAQPFVAGAVGLAVLRARDGHVCTELPWKGPGWSNDVGMVYPCPPVCPSRERLIAAAGTDRR